MTKRRRLFALGAAGLGAATGLAILVIAPVGAYLDNRTMSEVMMSDMGMLPELPVPPTIHYGAIAFAPSGASGKAWHQRSPERAAQVALEQCGDISCKVISNFKQCGAVAYNGSDFAGGVGLTRRVAEDDATNRLGGGWIVNWACN
ncbi:hypothetical protein LAUMK13_02923 [Mycobacterium innocens]|uniref:DUF4189 domain-containing protein n=2 Tax=Mycobacterium innocens TaxID=2341083 RepID=A0A498Q6X0_9MYCO|nr:hypothetical protein LAUMK13_02923 [Mycobacterium innocens]